MKQVVAMVRKKELQGEDVPNEAKVFSIYQQHTDIIVKGGREVQFGHKVNLAGGKSGLILSSEVLRGNPADSTLYQQGLQQVITAYGVVPRDSACDGGYASAANKKAAEEAGVINIVFNQGDGQYAKQGQQQFDENPTEKWRSGIEAVISNLKRDFKLRRCNWSGWQHFEAQVKWSVIGYNIGNPD